MDFRKKREKELIKAEKRRERMELREIRNQYRPNNGKLTTTKKIVWFIMINCTIVELYSMVVMYLFQDLAPLYSLIGAVVGESISFGVYCAKSYNETKSENELAFEREMFAYETEMTEEGIGDMPEEYVEETD